MTFEESITFLLLFCILTTDLLILFDRMLGPKHCKIYKKKSED